MTNLKKLRKTRNAFSKTKIYYLWRIFAILFLTYFFMGNNFHKFLLDWYHKRYLINRLLSYNYSKEYGALEEDIDLLKKLSLEDYKKFIILLIPNLESKDTRISEQAFRILENLPYQNLESIYTVLKQIFEIDLRPNIQVRALRAFAKMKLHSEERFQILSENVDEKIPSVGPNAMSLLYCEFYQNGEKQKKIEKILFDVLQTTTQIGNSLSAISVLKNILSHNSSIAIPLLEYLVILENPPDYLFKEIKEALDNTICPKKEEIPKLIFLSYTEINISQEVQKLLEKFASENTNALSTFIECFKNETNIDAQKTILNLIREAYTSSSQSQELEEKILSFFLQVFQTLNPDVKIKFIETLEKLKLKKNNQILLSFLDKEEWQIRAKIAWALGQSGEQNAIPILLQMFKDENEYVKENVAFALTRLQIPQEQIPYLEEIIISEKNLTVKNILAQIVKQIKK